MPREGLLIRPLIPHSLSKTTGPLPTTGDSMSGRRSSNKGARTERATRLLLGHGLPRPVIALPETKATILAPSGANLFYGRQNQLTPGLIGDSNGGGVEP